MLKSILLYEETKMKKLATVLVLLMILVCAVFADTTSSELKITLTIEAIAPTFKLYGSLTSGTAYDGTGMVAGQTVTNPKTAPNTSLILDPNSIINNPVYVYCVIRQTNVAKYTGTATVSITATDFEDANNTVSEATVSTVTAMNNNAGRTVTGGVASATITYTGVSESIADIASFNVQYAQADLIPGTYTSYITTTFDAP